MSAFTYITRPSFNVDKGTKATLSVWNYGGESTYVVALPQTALGFLEHFVGWSSGGKVGERK